MPTHRGPVNAGAPAGQPPAITQSYRAARRCDRRGIPSGLDPTRHCRQHPDLARHVAQARRLTAEMGYVQSGSGRTVTDPDGRLGTWYPEPIRTSSRRWNPTENRPTSTACRAWRDSRTIRDLVEIIEQSLKLANSALFSAQERGTLIPTRILTGSAVGLSRRGDRSRIPREWG
jgi:hypothetical protein